MRMCEIALSGLVCFIVGFIIGRIEYYIDKDNEEQKNLMQNRKEY